MNMYIQTVCNAFVLRQKDDRLNFEIKRATARTNHLVLNYIARWKNIERQFFVCVSLCRCFNFYYYFAINTSRILPSSSYFFGRNAMPSILFIRNFCCFQLMEFPVVCLLASDSARRNSDCFGAVRLDPSTRIEFVVPHNLYVFQIQLRIHSEKKWKMKFGL